MKMWTVPKLRCLFTNIDILHVASMHRIVIHYIDISIHIDESLHLYMQCTLSKSEMVNITVGGRKAAESSAARRSRKSRSR